MSILSAALSLVRALPLRLAVPCGRGIVLLYLVLSPGVRCEIGANFRRFSGSAHGSLVTAHRVRAFWIRQAWRLGENLALMAHMGSPKLNKMLDTAEVTGENVLEQIMLADRRVVVLSLHYGLWELLPQLFSRRGFGTCIAVAAQRDQGLDTVLSGMRRQPGVSLAGSWPELCNSVRRGDLVGFALDNSSHGQRPPCDTIWPGFRVLRSPFSLARAEHASLVPMFMWKEGDRMRVDVQEPVSSPEEFGERARGLIARRPEDWVFWGKG